MIKMIVIIVLEPDSRVDLGLGLGHRLNRLLTWINIRIKKVIIVLKPYLRVDPRPNSGHWPG